MKKIQLSSILNIAIFAFTALMYVLIFMLSDVPIIEFFKEAFAFISALTAAGLLLGVFVMNMSKRRAPVPEGEDL